MPSDPTRTTRSGRVLKKTSKSSLTTRSPATGSPATSRSRHRDSSSNQNPRSKRTNLPNMSSPRLDAAKAAALRKRIAEEEERIQRVLDGEAEVVEDLEGTYTALVERRKELEANASEYNRGRTSSRSHRRHRSASSASSSSNEQRSSFKEVGHSHGKTLTSSIHHRFPAVAKTHIDNIFRCNFDARNLLQLGNSFSALIAKDANEIESTTKLLRCVEVYCQIVCHFAPSCVSELQTALSCFRLKLLEYLEVYTFASVREWCFCIISLRISTGQDDPAAWMNGEPDLQYKLAARPKTTGIPLRSTPSSPASRSENTCRNFNRGSCTMAACKYQHTCSSCGNSGHPAARCSKAASGSNSTPLADRVQRP